MDCILVLVQNMLNKYHEIQSYRLRFVETSFIT